MPNSDSIPESEALKLLTGAKSILTVTEDIDPYGKHLHHTGSLKIFERERARIFGERGMPLGEMATKEGLVGVVYNISIRYPGEIMEGDEVEVSSQVFQSRPTSLLFRQTITKEGKSMVEADVQIVVKKEGRPVRVPPEMLDKLRG